MLRRARTDHLTGLPSRTRFEEQLAQTLADRPEIARGGAVAYVDIDEFKLVNDTASHAAGDEAIRQLAAPQTTQILYRYALVEHRLGFCRREFPRMVCRPVSAQFMSPDRISFSGVSAA